MPECSICCNERVASVRLVQCGVCRYTACVSCQKKYQKLSCMFCQARLPKTEIETRLGREFYNKVERDERIAELVREERKLIPDTQPLLEYKMQREAERETFRRTGVKWSSSAPCPSLKAPNEPQSTFLCTKPECIGVLSTSSQLVSRCLVCSTDHCTKCRSAIALPHVCDETTLQSVVEIDQTTRPCPRCQAPIFRTQGCDHMHCTQCNVHFDWKTLTVLKRSTNEHYTNSVARVTALPKRCEPVNYLKMHVDQKELPTHKQKPPALYMQLLYEQPGKVCAYYAQHFRENQLERSYAARRDALRVQYLQQRLSEEAWGVRLYTAYREYEIQKRTKEVLEYYLESIFAIQDAVPKESKGVQLFEYYRKAVDAAIHTLRTCNLCFTHLNDEFCCRVNEATFQFTIPDETTEETVLCFQRKRKRDRDEDQDTTKGGLARKCQRTLQVELRPYQVDHAAQLANIANQVGFAIDRSPMGSGKTPVACSYFQNHPRAHRIVVCPSSLVEKWESTLSLYGIDARVVSYSSFAGTKLSHPSHGWLLRDDYSTNIVQRVAFTPSKLFQKMLSEGVDVVFDECQQIKNDRCVTTQAVRTFQHALLRQFQRAKNCHSLFLSGTPIDKEAQAVPLLRNLGILQDESIFPRGMTQIKSFCKRVLGVDGSTFSAIAQYVNNAQSAREAVYQLTVKLILPLLSVHMSAPALINRDAKVTQVNTFYRLSDHDAQVYTNVMKELVYFVESGEAQRAPMGLFAKLAMIEQCKIETIAEEVRATLHENAQCKVVIALNFSESIRLLREKLGTVCTPLVVCGEVSPKERDVRIRSFQEANLTHRVLIANIEVVQSGIDLDDKHGSFPRIVFLSPTLKTIHMQQFAARFLRSTDTKSNTLIRHVYSVHGITNKSGIDLDSTSHQYTPIERQDGERPDGNVEMRVIKLLSDKMNVLRAVSANRFFVAPKELDACVHTAHQAKWVEG